jgi:diguanylate cyclase (GGDEF)-like protein
MKITGARTEPYAEARARPTAAAGGPGTNIAAAAVDEAAFLGLRPAELTPAVQAAVQALLSELDGLREEVGRLKARLTEMEDLADRDALTPLLNRRALLRELSRVRTFSERYGSPASLVYFDMDGFKAVNDRFGHPAGDEALKAVAERLTAHVRESDIVGRMGGDEFAVILVQADRATAEAKGEALKRAIEEPVEIGDWSAPLHVSFGVCEITPDADPEVIVAQADAAMYARKRERGG